MKDILNIKNLRVNISSSGKIFKVIDDISLNIKEKSTLGLVGESGCGKTMTALSIMRLLPGQAEVISGEIFFNNEDVLKFNKGLLRDIRGNKVAMVFQEPGSALNPVFTIGEQLKEAVLAHRKMTKQKAKDYVLDLISKVKLRNPEFIFNSYPHNLSGGMKQRVMIAMGISLNPKLLILDEPTTSLDVTVQAHILELIEELKSELGISILFITHNLGIVARLADEISIMYAGKIIERADKNEIFYNTRHPYTKGLLLSLPNLGEKKNRLDAIKGEAPDLSNIPSGCPFHPRCPLKIEICEQKIPEYREITTNHFSRCHLAEKVTPN